MTSSCALTGMVIFSAPSGEYDKRITLLTKERGKITGFVRGARRPKSSMISATDPFCFGIYEAYEGRNAYTVVKADVKNYFREISSDLELTAYGLYFLEVADYFYPEHADASDQLKLIYQTLRALGKETIPNRLIRCIYELKTLVFFGTCPDFSSCIPGGPMPKQVSGLVLDELALYTISFIMSTSVEKLYTFSVKDDTIKVLEQVCRRLFGKNVDKRMKTLDFLNSFIV